MTLLLNVNLEALNLFIFILHNENKYIRLFIFSKSPGRSRNIAYLFFNACDHGVILLY